MNRKKPPKVQPLPTPSPPAVPQPQQLTNSIVAIRTVVLGGMRELALDAVNGKEELLHLVPLAMATMLADRMDARSSSPNAAAKMYAATIYVLALIPPLQAAGIDLDVFTRRITLLLARLNEVSNAGK